MKEATTKQFSHYSIESNKFFTRESHDLQFKKFVILTRNLDMYGHICRVMDNNIP